jgi:hypothetical protein
LVERTRHQFSRRNLVASLESQILLPAERGPSDDRHTYALKAHLMALTDKGFAERKIERKSLEQRSLRHIGEKFAEEFRLMDDTLDFAEDVLTAGKLVVMKGRGLNKGVLYELASILAKSCKTFRAIRACARAGCGQDAAILLRALYETCLAALYILQKDSRKRAALYAAHTDVRKLIAVLEAKKTPGLKRRITKTTISKAQAKADSWLALVTATELAAVRKHWGGPGGIESVARRLRRGGWLQAYNTIYRRASAFSHGADVDVHLIATGAGNTPTVKLLPGEDEIARVARVGSVLVIAICKRMNERFGMDLDTAALDALVGRAKALSDR